MARKSTTKGKVSTEEQQLIVKINGWAALYNDSTVLHALPAPVDLGGHGQALCGHSAARGWAESDRPERYKCNACMVQIERYFKEERLDAEDRRWFLSIQN